MPLAPPIDYASSHLSAQQSMIKWGNSNFFFPELIPCKNSTKISKSPKNYQPKDPKWYFLIYPNLELKQGYMYKNAK